MGASFNNLHIYNTKLLSMMDVHRILSILYCGKNILETQNPEEAEFTIRFVTSDNGEWFSFYSDMWEGLPVNTMREVLLEYVKAFKSYGFGAVVNNSDSLKLCLYDYKSKKEDIVALGQDEEYDEMIDVMDLSVDGNSELWEKIIGGSCKAQQLSDIWYSDYVYAEDIVSRLGEYLEIGGIQAASGFDDWRGKDMEYYSGMCLHFYTYRYNDSIPPIIVDAPTELWWQTKSNGFFTICNRGGVSKGLTVLVRSEYIAEGILPLTDVTIKKQLDFKEINPHPVDGYEILPVSLKRTQLPDGEWVLLDKFDDFIFPEGVNVHHSTMQGKKCSDALHSRSLIVYYTSCLLENGFAVPFDMILIPHQNSENGCVIL